jgi:hypothetical protein
MNTHTPCPLYARCSLLAFSAVVSAVCDGHKPLSHLTKWFRDTISNAKTCYLVVEEDTFTTYVPVSKSWVRSRLGNANHPDGILCDVAHKHCSHGVLVVSLRANPFRI